jgi:deoxyribonuclease V
VLRTRDNTRLLYISPGHQIDLNASIRLTLSCTGIYRIPEPLRCADMLSKKNKNDSPSGRSRKFRTAGL